MPKTPKVLIATGGTGGHIFPALSLADELRQEGVECHFAGGKLSANPYFPKNLPFDEVRVGGGWRQSLAIFQGVYDSCKLLDRHSCHLVVGFGSYTTFPLLLAAKLKGVPYILYAADTVPGKVIRWFSPYAKMTAVQFPEAVRFLSGPSKVVLPPLRKGYRKSQVDREEARAYFGLSGQAPVVLVFGGSKGAEFLNKIVPQALADLKRPLEVVHITGAKEEVERVLQSYTSAGIKASVKPFEDRMDLAWGVAKVACMRAGAGSIAEAIEFRVPSLLIPYPHAMEGHQDKNADYFLTVMKGVKCPEAGLDKARLSCELNILLENETQNEPLLTSHPPLKSLIMESLT